MNFYTGFEKAASTNLQDSGGLAGLAMLGISGATMTGEALITGLSGAADRLDRWEGNATEEQLAKLENEFREWGAKKKKHVADIVATSDIGQNAYYPAADLVISEPRLSTRGHELGHSVKGNKTLSEISLAMYSGAQSPLIKRLYTVGAPAAAAFSDNEVVSNAAIAAPFVISSPVLLEEGRASAHALRRISKAFGAKAALKAAPRLAAAFGTYAALPTAVSGAAYAIKKYRPDVIERFRKNREKEG